MEGTIYTRTGLLLGEKAIEKLKKSSVIIFGIGGVGGTAIEAIVRAGVGNVCIVDFDEVDVTNINRQVIALNSTIGIKKVDIMKKRLLDINPNLKIETKAVKLDEETIDDFGLENYDYVIDAIDMIKSKIMLILRCKNLGINIISSMGMGFRLDPTKIRVVDIFDTSYDPLARLIRKEMRLNKIKDLKVVCSEEIPVKKRDETGGVTASISFVPPAAGLAIASAVIRDLTSA